jgi:hypothetical protein
MLWVLACAPPIRMYQSSGAHSRRARDFWWVFGVKTGNTYGKSGEFWVKIVCKGVLVDGTKFGCVRRRFMGGAGVRNGPFLGSKIGFKSPPRQGVDRMWQGMLLSSAWVPGAQTGVYGS